MDPALPYHLVRLARPHTCAGGLLATLAGAHLARGDTEPVRMVLAGAGIVLLIAAAQTYNDARDAVPDRIAKPHRPVAAGAVSVRTATIAAATYVALAVGSAVPLGVLNVGLAAVLAGASYAYSAGLKGHPLLGNLLVGVTTGSAAVYGALAVGQVGGRGRHVDADRHGSRCGQPAGVLHRRSSRPGGAGVVRLPSGPARCRRQPAAPRAVPGPAELVSGTGRHVPDRTALTPIRWAVQSTMVHRLPRA